MDFFGTTLRDSIVGTVDADVIDVSQGNRDTVAGLEGDDVILFGGELNANDEVDGGDDHDTVVLEGNYLGGLVLLPTTLVNIEEIVFEAGFNYALTLDDATAAGAVFYVDAALLGAGDALVFDGSAETAAVLDFKGGAGDDVLTGGDAGDVFDLDQGGGDTVAGLDGADEFTFMGAFSADDEIDGGAGFDRVTLDGDYSGGVTFGPATMLNVEELWLEPQGYDYDLVFDDATADPLNGTFYLNASLIGSTKGVVLDFSAETNASYDVSDGDGDDVITAGFFHTSFRLGSGGEDTITGSSSFDIFYMYDALSAGDSLVGGFGSDTLWLAGDYSAGLVITGAMVSGFEDTQISPQHDVNLTYLDEVVAAFYTHRINVPSYGAVAGHQIIVDGSDETDGYWAFMGAISDDTFLGGALADDFDFQTTNGGGQGGIDIVEGNGGDDIILFDEKFTRDDQVDGGAGFDELELEGDYNAGVNFNGSTIADLELITLAAGHSYGLTVGNNNVRADGFTVDGSALAAGEALTYDGSAETASDVIILGGLGDDVIAVGGGGDSLRGSDGADSLTGGAGDDTLFGGRQQDTLCGGLGRDHIYGDRAATRFVWLGVAESTGPGHDVLGQLKPLKDHFDLDVAVTGVDARVNAGALSEATFDADLAAAIGAGQLGAGHAVVFKPNAGTLAGDWFLIVDANGTAGYQAGLDYVMEFAAGSHPNSIAVGFFI